MFAFEALGLGDFVDVCAVGKMSQVCAVLFTPEYNPKPGLISQTFLGTGETLRVGREVLERLSSGNYYGKDGSNARHHKLFRDSVRALAAKHPEWFPASHEFVDIVEGTGGMMRFSPFGGQKDPVMKLCKTLFDEGLIVFYCGHGPYHIRMLPPLGVMQESHWPKVFELIEAGMTKIAAQMNRRPAKA
jgi:acetylornithine aminotransferase